MLKLIVASFLFSFIFNQNLAFDVENYTAFIDELNHNTKFIDEYMKWSTKLVLQSNYLYGDIRLKSSCSIDDDDDDDDDKAPESVHSLRPKDINCIGALGDSFTTGLNSHAITPADLLLEHRGLSWSIGGDYTYSQIVTLPNILKEFNSKLKGFSVKKHELSLNRQNINDNRLNMAKSGSNINSLPDQAKMLVRLLKNETFCNWTNDWKLITIFLGINDLCMSCKLDLNESTYTHEQYGNSIRDTLDTLYNASVPRMFINLVHPPDIRGYRDLSMKNYVCQTFLNNLCPCASQADDEQLDILKDSILKYQKVLTNLIQSKRYDVREDFTVVIQPFMLNTPYPFRDQNNTIDTSYLAPDCFHFSGKAHSQIAHSLWNNMFEPVGGKQSIWSINQMLKCPTRKYPYLFTSRNSDKALAELKRSTNRKPLFNLTTSTYQSNVTSILNSTITINYNSTIDSNITSTTITDSSSSSFNVTIEQRINTKKSLLSWSYFKLFLLLSCLFLFIFLLILNFRKRRHIRMHIHQADNPNFNRLDEESDNSDIEVYIQPNQDAKFYDDKQMTSTHGTRMSFQ